ncbi:antitoxin Xre-like helix-turn-helix domain-containing protein [Variovorax sp. KK3]|uniref:antitoxin Xre-like helix-turn-helix domain-containing protein n=1 Tax=Variovorax sp. KK3 TaxID=1855728 RepID=UPI002118B506|nr:antitoxin Xre-like helix-turn-helix domain-containing protein [Variovorax sp. KK3]
MTGSKPAGRKAAETQAGLKYARTPPAPAVSAHERHLSGYSSRANGSRRYFEAVFLYDPLERIELVKAGVPAQTTLALANAMGISKDRLFQTLGLPRATIDRKLREGKVLSSDESSRVLGMARLVGQVQAMVEASGDPAGFNAAEWVAQWLARPVGALGGRQPGEFMDTAEGQALVSNLLKRAVSGAYS